MLKKLLIFGVGGLLVILAVVVIGAAVLINAAARKGIEAGGSYALGVKTELRSARVGLVSGRFGMSGLKVANPAGFPAPHFLTLGDARVAVSLGTLMEETVELPELTLESIDVRLEKKDDTSNYQVILDNLKKIQGKPDPSKPKPAEKKEGKKFVIKQLTVRNVTVHAQLVGGPVGEVTGVLTDVTVPIDEIRLTDVGKTGTGVAGTGVTLGELSGIIVQAVLAAAVAKGGDILPADIGKGLQDGLSGLQSLADMGIGGLGDLGGEVGKAAEGIGKEGGKAIEEVTKGIGDLLKGKK
jgi:hypothetical protein